MKIKILLFWVFATSPFIAHAMGAEKNTKQSKEKEKDIPYQSPTMTLLSQINGDSPERPQKDSDEIRRMRVQTRNASRLFDDVLALCKQTLETTGNLNTLIPNKDFVWQRPWGLYEFRRCENQAHGTKPEENILQTDCEKCCHEAAIKTHAMKRDLRKQMAIEVARRLIQLAHYDKDLESIFVRLKELRSEKRITQ